MLDASLAAQQKGAAAIRDASVVRKAAITIQGVEGPHGIGRMHPAAASPAVALRSRNCFDVSLLFH